jgi:hypothetical protein
MLTLADSEIRDLATGTLKELGRLKFNQIATTYQRYEVMGRIMRKDKVEFEDGTGIQRSFMIDQSGAARMVGMFASYTRNVGDVLRTTEIPWRHTNTYYMWERREMLMNNGKSRIVPLMRLRRADAMISLAKLMEDEFWSKPTDSTDKLHVFGVPYWVVKNATLGFNGGAPTGFAAGAGGLLHARWQNYTGQYVSVSKPDLIKKMRKAHRLCDFQSPTDIPDYRNGAGDQYRIYMNEVTLSLYEDLAETQNQNLGRDLAPMDDTTSFRRNPVRYVPKLDEDTANPVYMLNFADFHPVFLKGDYLREAEPRNGIDAPNNWFVDIDMTWNVLCTNRRTQAVFYQ